MTSRKTRGKVVPPRLAAIRLHSLFVQAVARFAPEVLLDLRDNVLPVYAGAASAVPNQRLLHPWRAVANSSVYPDRRALWTAVGNWATKHNLVESDGTKTGRAPAGWVCSAALLQLEYWHGVPDHAYPRCSYPRRPSEATTRDGWYLPWNRFETIAMRIPSVVPPVLPAWQRTQSWQDYENEVKERLADYRATVEALWGKAKVLSALERHLEWFVLYQVCDCDYPVIARGLLKGTGRRPIASELERAAEPVRKAVPRVARCLGLKPRQGPGPGRPRFSETTNTRDHKDTLSRPHRRPGIPNPEVK
jgi:hypothetical protein